MTADRTNQSPATLEGRRALVTGGMNGMGHAIAQRLSQGGAEIVVVDIATRADLPPAWTSKTVDVTDEAAVTQLASEFADNPVDILVNAVGIYPQASFMETSFELWRRIMSINCDSAFLMSRAFAPQMASRGWGRIVNIASNSFHGGDLPNYSAYIASKGCMIGLTRGMATDLGKHGVTVNAIAPGLVQTENMVSQRAAGLFDEVAAQQSIKRSQQPEDVAGATAFLASDEAGFVTGQTIVVDGGLIRV
jgi:NAD(P)-dependent dehydrogenase (short-subunit alcohol dehydrogenase family)